MTVQLCLWIFGLEEWCLQVSRAARDLRPGIYQPTRVLEIIGKKDRRLH
jgi:hypothetical protein